ncbi:uncharacterized protein B0H18DRAFT_955022 [Fomitopsis serialis]|uniref:uncharacterized protein n=1 Tax=Fomitopsis serialis TaxID=139415 RepID=UPI0020083EE2|nr:uncharacterized protein B0H18DRAFT_955022 [Neoantrodia serialis]KAH9925843.1 hypothetical protein B0H18DRAFT_955022 [Neoantrodia serialis]
MPVPDTYASSTPTCIQPLSPDPLERHTLDRDDGRRTVVSSDAAVTKTRAHARRDARLSCGYGGTPRDRDKRRFGSAHAHTLGQKSQVLNGCDDRLGWLKTRMTSPELPPPVRFPAGVASESTASKKVALPPGVQTQISVKMGGLRVAAWEARESRMRRRPQDETLLVQQEQEQVRQPGARYKRCYLKDSTEDCRYCLVDVAPQIVTDIAIAKQTYSKGSDFRTERAGMQDDADVEH